jgi:hypothetical protein
MTSDFLTKRPLKDYVKITPLQSSAAYQWIEYLESGKLEDEQENYLLFASIILEKILDYKIENIEFENGVEFQIKNSKGRRVLCFEAKGTSTKNLFSTQHRDKREHKTPIKQTWDYMGEDNLDYGVCTNYKHFILIDKIMAIKNIIYLTLRI